MSGDPQLQLGCLWLSGLATTATLVTVFILRSRKETLKSKNKEKTNSVEDDFEEINSHLQTDLNNKIIERISEVKNDIKARKLQLNKNVNVLLEEQESEIRVKWSEFEITKEIIENKYTEKINSLKEETETDITEMKEALKSLRVILASSNDTAEMMNNTKGTSQLSFNIEINMVLVG